ncbi:XRE family transcriptional regulator [Shewanella eurypsychrophilus]|uniref:XRE family transcriptional regulator n=1 Tax=Shewanella eurypsychrophilus TaxID=2593656 RepID=A0ABX6V632_9GAMM|nr:MULTISPECIES: XRE family transcriptional regulator [Shewanella]QFU21995.1 XRE family transcriptional regulator [Shewanella sp. YLB-09]QPG57284.1 XRE family transcriptional regulator [Shewanella eurypsychrophilus]
MELFSLLLKIRTELESTQAEMVEKLSLHHEVFANLDLITYSRWERGVSMPSTLRIIHLLSFAQYDVIRYLVKLDLKLSKTKINQMRRIEAHAYDQHDLIQGAFYPIPDASFKHHSGSEPLTDMDKLQRICDSSGRFFKFDHLAVRERCERSIILQQKHALHILTCEGKDDSLYAHAMLSVHNMHEREQLRSEFRHFYNTPRAAQLSGDKVMFFHSVMRFNLKWWEFTCLYLIQVLCREPDIQELFMIVRDKSAAQIYANFGFKVEAKAENEDINPFGGRRKLISISRDDFLSHHGIIAWLKAHADLLKD